MKTLPAITTCEHPEGIALVRDGEELLTPKRHALVVPNEALAAAIASEFSVKDSPKHLTKIAYSAIDLVPHEYDGLVEAMLAYLHTDSICYFAEAPELSQREHKYWQPIIDWASEHFSVDVLTFEGVMPADQPPDTAETLKQHIHTLGDWHVACLLDFTRGFGSLILALAVLEGRLDAQTAFECSQVDEDWQREQWGAEDEAMERREKLKTEMLACEQFLSLI
jgi:chaperone required for assembly of F1-ATPase